MMSKDKPIALHVPNEKYEAILKDRDFWKEQCTMVENDLPDYVDQQTQLVHLQRDKISLRYEIYELHKKLRHWKQPYLNHISDLEYKMKEAKTSTVLKFQKMGMDEVQA